MALYEFSPKIVNFALSLSPPSDKFENPNQKLMRSFWGWKFQNGFTQAKLRGRDQIFRYCQIIRSCSFTWASQNKFSTTLQISGFISTESHYEIFILNKKRTRYRPLVSLTFYYNPPSIEKGPPRSKNQVGEFWILNSQGIKMSPALNNQIVVNIEFTIFGH